jgi:DegV family protein with EDD domain
MQNALSAASKLVGDRISVVDSLNVSSGTGLQILEAAELADRGFGLAEITERALALRPKVRAGIVLDTLKFVYLGGRCSRLASIVGDTLNIKPTINIIDGEVVLGERLRGKRYVERFVELVVDEPERIDPKRIFVTHCLESDEGEVKTRLERDFGFKNVIVADASPAISVHTGPGALGIMYMYK